ncbi:2-hydroxyacid dehydrogenase [Caldivirga maquilingensis]|uniref:D-isomer specific 2-hydroxyacid dehydrogenase NAD-binding n=1 Tax=Caldivirga maquilingensis (strain ATCC 700844 / DSM 13496 / JCM 10307 / IC-167) TaxID=397948 RepID=A8MCK7_CALMQ|nr:2-hydroxyacid dehydrogenase [Caldivirga maquilingensis]ABW01513.1 D-isomer specific 2-hydroxyacid dehydrogenase NAD-binding [Caldivirga maquilingensis IC-167]
MVKVVASTIRLPEEAKVMLSSYAKVYELPNLSEPELIKVLGEVNALLCWCGSDFDLTKWVRYMPNLEVIQTFSAGVDHLPYSSIPSNVKIYSNAGAYSVPVAEHAWALILTLAKGIHSGLMDRGNYLNDPAYSPRQLTGRNLLVLGTGGIGSEVARVGKLAFSMRTIGVNRSGRPAQYFDEVHPISELKGVLPRANVMVVALPLTKYTRGLLGEAELNLLPEDAIVVNVARGDIVKEDDLYRVLTRRRGLRFGTDVFWDYGSGESLNPRTGLLNLPNFIGTPHIAGGAQPDVARNAVIMAVTNLTRYLKGEHALNEVNRSDYV